MPAPKRPDPRVRVESALKATIDSELKRAATDGIGIAGSFSRGAIFSKADGFSKGIIFSRAASQGDRLDEIILPDIAELDDAAFGAFAERLGALQKVKSLKAEVPQTQARK